MECIDDKDLAKEAARILEEDVGASLESPIEVARLWITAFGLFEERHRNLFRNFLQGKMAIKKLLLKWIGLRMRSKNPGPEDESIRSSIEALLSNFAGDTVKRVMPKVTLSNARKWERMHVLCIFVIKERTKSRHLCVRVLLLLVEEEEEKEKRVENVCRLYYSSSCLSTKTGGYSSS